MTNEDCGNEKDIDLDSVLVTFKIRDRYHVRFIFVAILLASFNSFYTINYVFVAEYENLRCSNESTECNKLQNETSSLNTFVKEMNIENEEWKSTLVGSSHSFGYMIGLILVGPLSDRIGRKNVILLYTIFGGILGLVKSFLTSYWLYIILEFLEACFGDIYSPLFTLCAEITSSQDRVKYLLAFSFGSSISVTLMGLYAWLFPYWRHFLRFIYAPQFLIAFLYFVLDESPRWLLSKGKKRDVTQVITKIANTNKIIMEYDLKNLKLVAEKNESVCKLLKKTFSSNYLLKNFMMCIVWWFTCTFVNYGIILNSVTLIGNKYINFALVLIVELPAQVISYVYLLYFNKKSLLVTTFWTGSILNFAHPFISTDSSILSTAFFMASKLLNGIYFSLVYIVTAELFPTYTRNSMHAICSAIGRIGAILSPQTSLLLLYWHGLPSILFGMTSLIAGIITFFGPNIDGATLPDTILEAENLSKNGKRSIKQDDIRME